MDTLEGEGLLAPGQHNEDLGEIVIAADEAWIEFGPPDARRRTAFHDYATLYSVPGLYQHVFYDLLAMCTVEVLAELYRDALTSEGLDPAAERVLELGAGNGIAGAELRSAGVGHVVAIDLEPVAAVAAERDHPGVYADFLVTDLGTLDDAALEALRSHRFTTLLAFAAIGEGHVPVPTLERALGLLEPRGLFGFAVTPSLMPGSEDERGRATGYPDFLGELLGGTAEVLAQREYVHRTQGDGTTHDAVAVVGRLRSR